jgi:hypothetical protein
MPVTLENRLRQMQVFNLDHETYCAGTECACSQVTAVVVDENPRTGERAPRRVTRRAPGSLTLLARERRQGLSESVLQVPEVRAAIERGSVRVIEQTPGRPTRIPASLPVKEE